MNRKTLGRYKHFILMVREIVNFVYNIKQRYFHPKTFVYDELVRDPRNDKYADEMAGNSTDYSNMPTEFICKALEYPNQNVKGYKYSCTAQGTAQAVNAGNRLWNRWEPMRSGFDLFDLMVDLWLASRTAGAYGIDAVKTSQKEKHFYKYYQIDNLKELKSAIYSGAMVTLGSKKIDWSDCRDGLVKSIGSSYWHFFYGLGYDDDKKIGTYVGWIWCANSYWPDYQDNWGFWIPYTLINQGILFNTRCAIIVNGRYN